RIRSIGTTVSALQGSLARKRREREKRRVAFHLYFSLFLLSIRTRSRMGVEARRLIKKANKNAPPILSHEFVIQNHGDITSVILMVVFLGFMWQQTSAIAQVFVLPQYNETINLTVGENIVTQVEGFRVGLRDIFTVLFYTVACVTVHAIIQEYVIDKLIKKICRDSKLSVSKTKLVKLNESGQLFVFWAYTLAHALWVLSDYFHTFNDVGKLWLNYPEEHRIMSLRTKFFFIIQLAYWLHSFPEFYLQKYKGEEMKERTLPILIHIAAITAGYALNFNRITLVLLSLEAIVGVLFHAARFLHIIECKNTALRLFHSWNIVFVVARLLETFVAAVVFWHGFKVNETPFVDFEQGNFNTSFIRLNALFVVVVLQGYQFAQFALFHFGRFRDSWSKKAKKTQSNAAISTAKNAAKAKKEKKEE
ncbi:hypothetical protein PFISCL1PPCAC_14981, partial [Pristionchus fissidentatus]